MKGWRLFRHSVDLITRDLPSAFRVTGVPYLVVVAVTLLFPQTFGVAPEGQPATLPPWPAVLALPLYLAALLWLAVQWHRYALTGEVQSGYVPNWHGGPMLSYLGRFALLALITLPLIVAVVVPASLVAIALPVPGVALAVNLVALAAVMAVAGRISPILPAAALGRRLRISEAWERTRGATGPIVVLSALLAALMTLPALLYLAGLGAVATVAGLAFEWFTTLLGVSVITTLYGHYVEGRELT